MNKFELDGPSKPPTMPICRDVVVSVVDNGRSKKTNPGVDDMSDSNKTRRDFLKLFGTGAAGLAGISLIGCDQSAKAQSKTDRVDADASSPDAGTPPDPPDAGDAPEGQSANPPPDDCRVTGSDVEGPFYLDGAPNRKRLAPEDEPGDRLVVEGTVYGPDCSTPVSSALLDIWHASADGEYYDASNNYRLRGRLETDSEGHYRFETIKPGNYPMGGVVRPAHIHFNVSAPDLEPLTTQMYFAGDPHLGPDDPCSGCSSGDETLIIDLETVERDGTELLRGQFDIVLAAG